MEKLDKSIKTLIIGKTNHLIFVLVLEILSIDPLSEVLKYKKIKGKDNHYRVRVGDYRIIYSPQHDVLIVRVIRLGHRKDVYRYY